MNEYRLFLTKKNECLLREKYNISNLLERESVTKK